MDDLVSTSDLGADEFVMLFDGPDSLRWAFGKRYLVRLHKDTLSVDPATRTGERDQRFDTGWTGEYRDCRWKRLKRPKRKAA